MRYARYPELLFILSSVKKQKFAPQTGINNISRLRELQLNSSLFLSKIGPMVTMMKHSTILFLLLLLTLNTTNIFAANYYVKSDGNDSSNGTSDATAWKSINKVNKFTFKAGDDVYFKSGDTWKLKKLTIKWSGTEKNRAIIGAYYLQDGKEIIGLKSNSNRPIIAGGYISSTNIGTVPSSPYSGLILVKTGSYVTIQNLHIKDSSGYGIAVGSGNNINNIIENNYVTHTVGSLIFAYEGSNNTTIRNNLGQQCAWSVYDKIKPYNSHPGCIVIHKSSYALIENNSIYELYGEGIAIFDDANYNKVKGNLIANSHQISIYIENSNNNLIESNMILGDGDPNSRGSSGIGVAVESNTKNNIFGTYNNIIRNNLVAGTYNCLVSFIEGLSVTHGATTSGKFIGNTCVGLESGVNFVGKASKFGTWEVANNIFHDLNNELYRCSAPTDSKISFHHNSWEFHPSKSQCIGAGDVAGNPKLVTTSDFRLFSYSNQPLPSDFKPQATSPAIGQGKAVNELSQDYSKQLRPSSPTIGALEFSRLTNAITPPLGLRIIGLN